MKTCLNNGDDLAFVVISWQVRRKRGRLSSNGVQLLDTYCCQFAVWMMLFATSAIFRKGVTSCISIVVNLSNSPVRYNKIYIDNNRIHVTVPS